MSAVDLVMVVGTVVAVVAAVRSTWSPCGLSMLASITPLAERGRGHRYRSTATWFVAGAVIGGATLGGAMAVAAVAVRAVGPDPWVVATVVLATAALCSVSDSRVTGWHLPVHHRQVNERWLDGYRPWVYGAGFGWQIGSGLTTYIVTAGVYLMVVLGAVSGSPWVALALGTLFGLVRGLAVLLGRGVTSPSALHAVHRRMARLGPVSATLTSAVEATVALVAAAWLVAAAAGGRWASAGTRPGAVVLVTVGLGVIVAWVAIVRSGRRRAEGEPATSPVPAPAPRVEARRG
jgi:hypothetical protein